MAKCVGAAGQRIASYRTHNIANETTYADNVAGRISSLINSDTLNDFTECISLESCHSVGDVMRVQKTTHSQLLT